MLDDRAFFLSKKLKKGIDTWAYVSILIIVNNIAHRWAFDVLA